MEWGMNYHHSNMTKFIIWNTKGANSAIFRRNYEAIVKEYNPAMLVLLETKMC